MAGALVRGGAGAEIALHAILPPHLKSGLATRRDTEKIAREWERINPGCVVICDWELFDDDDIAAMAPAARELALSDRQALADRREAAAKLTATPEATRGGDPDRNRELLRRARNDMERLSADHPDYLRFFADLARQINQLEAATGQAITSFKPGNAVKKQQPDVSATRKSDLQERLKKYLSFPYTSRKANIDAAKDHEFAQMAFDAEPEQALRDLWALKLVELGAVATA